MTTDKPRSGLRLPHWGWFALVTVLLAIGWLALSIWLPYQREQQIVQKIERLGGSAQFFDGAPEWLRRISGEKRIEVFRRVLSISYDNHRLTDEDLTLVSKLTSLEGLYFWKTSVNNDDLAQLAGLTRLEDVQLCNTSVSDAGLVHFLAMKNLDRLNLDRTGVTDDGLAHLARLSKLRILFLDGTSVSDAGLFHLMGMKNLEGLTLNGTSVTDAGIEKLQEALPTCAIDHN